MEKVIFKFKLEIAYQQHIEMPKNTDILSVQIQNGWPCIWVLIDVDQINNTESRTFDMFGTGTPIKCHDSVELKFIDTFQLCGGSLVYHLFERIK